MSVKNLSNTIVEDVTTLARNYKRASTPAERKYYKKLLMTAVRHIEYFVEPLVSEEAKRIAMKNNLGDLKLQHWRAPGSWPAGKDLMFEHAKPASDITQEILSLSDLNQDSVREVLMTAEIAWITREENSRLPKANRQDWRCDYEQAGIKCE